MLETARKISIVKPFGFDRFIFFHSSCYAMLELELPSEVNDIQTQESDTITLFGRLDCYVHHACARGWSVLRLYLFWILWW
jgi:hypothetical protein